MARLRLNDISSFGTSNPVTFADGTTTTGSWSSSPPFPTISAPDYAVITVDPDTSNTEIVYLTAYTAGATSGTFIRAAETATGGRPAGSGVAHSATPWTHGPTGADFPVTYVGSDDPNGVQVGSPGETYWDTLNGGLWAKASGTNTNTGWVAGPVAPRLAAQNGEPMIAFITQAGIAPPVVNILGANPASVGNSVYIADALTWNNNGNGLLWSASNTEGQQKLDLWLGSTGQFHWTWDATGHTILPDAPDTGHSQTSGALPTISLTSGTGAQVDTTHDRTLIVPTSTAGTVQVELSPDGTTYTSIYTKTTAASDEVTIRVPARWRVRLTATTSTLGTGHYF